MSVCLTTVAQLHARSYARIVEINRKMIIKVECVTMWEEPTNLRNWFKQGQLQTRKEHVTRPKFKSGTHKIKVWRVIAALTFSIISLIGKVFFLSELDYL